MANNEPGKFIVIDGIDGSGKQALLEELKIWLERQGYEVAMADFPLVHHRSTGLAESYILGRHPEAAEPTPEQAAIFFAIDRFSASFYVRRWLRQGKIVLSSRYVTANMARQGAKIFDPIARRAFYEWTHNLEYGIFKLPQPDAVIFVRLNAVLAAKQVKHRIKTSVFRDKSDDFMRHVQGDMEQIEAAYLEIAELMPEVMCLSAEQNGRPIPKDALFDKLKQQLSDILRAPAPIQSAPDFQPPGPIPVIADKLSSRAKLPILDRTRTYKLFSSEDYTIFPGEAIEIKTGLTLEIPPEHIAVIYSSQSGQILQILDSSHSGEISFWRQNLSQQLIRYDSGDLVAHLAALHISKLNITPKHPET